VRLPKSLLTKARRPRKLGRAAPAETVFEAVVADVVALKRPKYLGRLKREKRKMPAAKFKAYLKKRKPYKKEFDLKKEFVFAGSNQSPLALSDHVKRFKPFLFPHRPESNGLVRFKSASKLNTASHLPMEGCKVKMLNRVGIMTESVLGLRRCTILDTFFTHVATTFKRLKGRYRYHWKDSSSRTRRFEYCDDMTIFKMAVLSVLSENRNRPRRLWECAKRSGKGLRRLLCKFKHTLDAYDKVLYSRACFHAKWLQHRAKQPRDESSYLIIKRAGIAREGVYSSPTRTVRALSNYGLRRWVNRHDLLAPPTLTVAAKAKLRVFRGWA
jgi:hypothetical protein